MWKFLNFAITQILREINFGDSRSAKSAIKTESVNFDLLIFALFEGCNSPNEHTSEPLKWQKQQF